MTKSGTRNLGPLKVRGNLRGRLSFGGHLEDSIALSSLNSSFSYLSPDRTFFNFQANSHACSDPAGPLVGPGVGGQQRSVTCPDNRKRHEELAEQQLLAEDLLQVLLTLHGEALKWRTRIGVGTRVMKTERHPCFIVMISSSVFIALHHLTDRDTARHLNYFGPITWLITNRTQA